jgi:hypothetical protein
MPTPVVPYQIPDWANPANASVLDSWAQKAIRTLGGLAGVADPVSQVMGLAAAPVDVPAANLAEGLGAKTLKAYHGSPKTLNELQPGSMMPTDPAWAAGYTTDPSWPGAGPDKFVGRVHVADVPVGGKTLQASSLHGAEDLLLRMAQQSLKRPARTLREAADAVSGLGYEAIVSKGSNGDINGVIPLRSVPVSADLDPVGILRNARSQGRFVADNLKAILDRLPSDK